MDCARIAGGVVDSRFAESKGSGPAFAAATSFSVRVDPFPQGEYRGEGTVVRFHRVCLHVPIPQRRKPPWSIGTSGSIA